jgi:ParB family chromosome partitioning protein
VTSIKGKGGLGKGLFALIPQEPEENELRNDTKEINLTQITANPFQPRREFDQEKLQELAESIKVHGVVQPVLLRQISEGSYQLVAGERRFRAAQQAGLVTIPAVVRQLSDSEMMEIALIENIQRQDLNPVEEARAYKRLAEEFKLTQDQIARRVSKSRSMIANSMRLLNLPDEVLEYLVQGKLTPGHVRPLLTLPEQEVRQLAKLMVEQKATVREAEAWARQLTEPKEKTPEQDAKPESESEAAAALQNDLQSPEKQKQPAAEVTIKELPVELKEIQRVLREAVQTKVDIQQTIKGGKIIIEYYSQDDIERILSLLTDKPQID